MRVFVTGGTGFIGSHTCQQILDAGHSIKLFVRNKAKAKAIFGGKVRSVVTGDICNVNDVKKALKGCDAAIHMAAMVSTDKGDAEKIYKINLAAAKNVLGQAVESGCKKIIHVSSVTAIYNPKAKKLSHTSPLGVAKNAYGRSKVDCERYARELQDDGAPLHITYPASVIGPDTPNLTVPHEGVIANLYGIGLNMPSGAQYVDVRDVAQAHETLLSKDLKPGRYPLAGHYISWKELYAKIEKLSGRNLVTIPIPGFTMRLIGRTVDVLNPLFEANTPITHEAMVYATKWIKMDSSKSEKELGLKFRPFEGSLIETIQWLERENYITRDQAGLLSRHSKR